MKKLNWVCKLLAIKKKKKSKLDVKSQVNTSFSLHHSFQISDKFSKPQYYILRGAFNANKLMKSAVFLK